MRSPLPDNGRIGAEALMRQQKIKPKLVGVPKMGIADHKFWKEVVGSVPGDLQRAEVLFMESWARLMQVEMANGKPLAEAAMITLAKADLAGIRESSQFSHAIYGLSRAWKYGEQLRQWFNLKHQRRDEGEKANKSGGVINPSIIALG